MELDEETTYVLIHPAGAAWAGDLPPRAERRAVRLGESLGPSVRSITDLLRLAAAARSTSTQALVFPATSGWFPSGGVPTVVGVHDLIGSEMPHLLFARRRDRLSWKAKESVAIRRARSLFTVSAATRAKVAKRFGIPPDEIELVRLAADPAFGPREPREVERQLEARGLEADGYLVYGGGLSPRKGLETLIEAYAALRTARGAVPPLLVAGESSWGERTALARALRRRVAEAGLTGMVRFTGFVPDDELACLYAGALAAVNPSRAEGFGLPAVEAAACGTPTVLSDLPAHRETLDEAAAFFAPGSVSALTNALGGILDDRARRDELAGRARRAVAGLSWDQAARSLRSAIDRGFAR